MINSLKTFFILVVLLHMNIVSANNNKIVYIDMDFLINNSKVGKSLSLQISKLIEFKKNISQTLIPTVVLLIKANILLDMKIF